MIKSTLTILALCVSIAAQQSTQPKVIVRYDAAYKVNLTLDAAKQDDPNEIESAMAFAQGTLTRSQRLQSSGLWCADNMPNDRPVYDDLARWARWPVQNSCGTKRQRAFHGGEVKGQGIKDGH